LVNPELEDALQEPPAQLRAGAARVACEALAVHFVREPGVRHGSLVEGRPGGESLASHVVRPLQQQDRLAPAGAIVLSKGSRAYTTSQQAMAVKPTARIRVRLTPRAARNAIDGWQGDVLRVRVTAPPVDGKANAALERLLAEALGLPQTSVRVAAGARGREKTVAIAGLSRDEALRRLDGNTHSRGSGFSPTATG
jgi:hypothetical protein